MNAGDHCLQVLIASLLLEVLNFAPELFGDFSGCSNSVEGLGQAMGLQEVTLFSLLLGLLVKLLVNDLS